MADFSLTTKQREFMFAKDKRLNFLSGSVRSGKTYVSVLKFLLWVAAQPADREFIMCGKTVGSLVRNCFNYIYEFIGEDNFHVVKTGGYAIVFGRRVWLQGGTDERSEGKIRGMTLAGAYCDEITLYPESFVVMLLTRLSVPGAKLWATCNPDCPGHFIKAKYIDRADELDCAVWEFLLTDNTHLPEDYLENLTKEFKGVYYNRFVLGQWVNAEGLVYPMFSQEENIVDEVPSGGHYYISMDYGTMNPTAMGLWCVTEGRGGPTAVMVKEYYYDGRAQQRLKTDEDYYNDLEEFAQGYTIQRIIIDPSAASFKACVRKRGKFAVMDANNDVLNGIRLTSSLIGNRRIKFHRSCTHTFKEFNLYSWDESQNVDAVIKDNDHCMDQIRYLCNTILRRM